MSDGETKSMRNLSADYVELAVKFISDNFYKKVSLADVAEYVGLSSGYLQKLFNRERQTSVIEYLLRYRVEQSCKLLIESDKTISEISDVIGFSDIKNFHYAFKRITGITPNEYRRAHKIRRRRRKTMTDGTALKGNGLVPRNKLSTEKVKAIIVISVVALCLVLFFFCNILTKSQMDIGVTFSYSFMTVLAVLFSGGEYSAFDEYGNPIDVSLPAAVTATLTVLFIVVLLTLVFTALRYTSLKNAKNISTIAYGAYLGNAALILTVYIWLMFFSGETSSLYGETVKYYTATA